MSVFRVIHFLALSLFLASCGNSGRQIQIVPNFDGGFAEEAAPKTEEVALDKAVVEKAVAEALPALQGYYEAAKAFASELEKGEKGSKEEAEKLQAALVEKVNAVTGKLAPVFKAAGIAEDAFIRALVALDGIAFVAAPSFLENPNAVVAVQLKLEGDKVTGAEIKAAKVKAE